MENELSEKERVKKIYKKLFVKSIKFDASTYILLITNIITIFLAIFYQWDILQIMFIYWIQSVIIGIFTFFKVLSIKKFSTEGVLINNKTVKPTTGIKFQLAFFFLIHYGLFHAGYLTFLLINKNLQIKPLMGMITIPIIIFSLNHLASFIINFKRDSQTKRNIGDIMGFPYIRIIPMHLTIIFGSFLIKSNFTLILFLALKTVADLIAHSLEHYRPTNK